ncbi:MAG: hypothetical protein RR365_01025 [Bacteroides sp.]
MNAKQNEEVLNMETSDAKPEKATNTKKKTSGAKLPRLDMTELVELQSCFYGKLFYRSRSGYTLTWAEFGNIQMIPIGELATMRNEQPTFFVNNWVRVVSDNADEVIMGLQLDRYYKDISIFEDFDEIFKYAPEELKSVISKMNVATKETVARRAYALIKDGTLDSNKIIEVLEAELGFELRD